MLRLESAACPSFHMVQVVVHPSHRLSNGLSIPSRHALTPAQHSGWFKQTSFHAVVHTNGNLLVYRGESPMSPDAKACAWGAFGCPGQGGVMEWKLIWISFRSKAGMIWCKVRRRAERDGFSLFVCLLPRKITCYGISFIRICRQGVLITTSSAVRHDRKCFGLACRRQTISGRKVQP